MSREGAIQRIAEYFENDGFFDDLARRVAIHTESQEPAQRPELYRYLPEEMTPYLELWKITLMRVMRRSLNRDAARSAARRARRAAGRGDLVYAPADRHGTAAAPP